MCDWVNNYVTKFTTVGRRNTTTYIFSGFAAQIQLVDDTAQHGTTISATTNQETVQPHRRKKRKRVNKEIEILNIIGKAL